MTISEQTTHDLIRHPMWCRHVPKNARYSGDPVGTRGAYDRMAPAEPDEEHEGQEYRLDTEDHFTYSLSVRAAQVFEQTPDGMNLSQPQVRLSIVYNELDETGEVAFLSLNDVDRLVAMLQLAQAEIIRG